MALPILARAAYVVLGVVPGGLREASYALGATRWQTVWRVVLPTARPGLATALILGIARAVGETSPVLLTSGASTFFNANPTQDPMNSLPLFIYTAVTSGSPEMEERAYAASAVLLELVHAGVAPAAIVIHEPDAILLLGLIVAREMGWPTPVAVRLDRAGFSAFEGLEVAVAQNGAMAATA
jgi:ABC-type phosphate transport system permease subunit